MALGFHAMGGHLTCGCLCGGVRFEIIAPLGEAGYCHCTRCQHRTGTAASANAALEPGSVRITAGEELIKAWRPDDGWVKLFCSSCGSALFSPAPDSDHPGGGRLRTLEGDPRVRPSYRPVVAYS